MKIFDLQWDDINLEHIIAKHHLSPKEVADVCFRIHYAVSARNKRKAVYGKTSSGKYIVVILERTYDNVYRPITAFGMKRGEIRKYKEIMGKEGS